MGLQRPVSLVTWKTGVKVMNMRTLCATFLLLVAGKFTNGENCDKLGILVYEDMACKPSHEAGNPCPTKYDCKGLTPSGTKCFFRGHDYTNGEAVANSPPCKWGCICQTNGGNSSEYACPQFGCQEWGREPQPGCYWAHTLDQCCSTGQKCPTAGEDIAKCKVDGVVYKEGEAFWPKGSCFHCICDKGFTGKYEAPFCKRTECGVQIQNQPYTQNKCAPLYLKDSNTDEGVLCCPRRWICHDGTENISHSSKPSHSDAKCSFGTTFLNIGDWFEKEITEGRVFKRNIKCECKIPPLLTCVEIPKA